MTADAPPPPAVVKTVNRRSRAEAAEIDRAKKTAAALPKLLAGIAAKDAHAANVRIGAAWVDQYTTILSGAESAAAGRAVARVDMKAATAEERKSAIQLAALLSEVRGQIATHVPADTHAQEAYGRGLKLSARGTGALIDAAGTFQSAWSGAWKEVAMSAGVTQATMDEIAALRASLSTADMGQHGVLTANADGTLQRAALFKVLRSMSAYAAKVVGNVYGLASSQLRSLSDPRPLTNRAAARKAETKTAKKAKKAAAAAKKAAKPKNRAAAVKRRAKKAAIAARVGALTQGGKAVVKRAKKKAKKHK